MCACMKLLLILMSVMTWTVETNTQVSGEGIWPYDIEVGYTCTYQKGTVRANDVATLSLGNLGGITVETIRVYLRSNKTGGAGTFSVKGNGQVIATKSGSLAEWTGSYDNENFRPVDLIATSVPNIDELDIELTGTANSLYIQKYEIVYSMASPRTVTLMRGDAVYATMSEPSGMQGVLLPSVPDSAQWKFKGWSKTHFWTVYEAPELLPAGRKYYPDEDCTLWAVFMYDDSPEKVYATELKSGIYMYVYREQHLALTGVPYEDGTMARAPIDNGDVRQHYQVDFAEDKAYITHVASGTPIGYSGTKMAAVASAWSVYHEGESTLFYTTIKNKNYVLWLSIYDSELSSLHAGLMSADPMSSPMALQIVAEPSEPSYTCHPELPQGLEETNEGTNETTAERVLMQIGNYELYLLNGRKELRIRK